MGQDQSKHQDQPLLRAVDEHKTFKCRTPFQALQLLKSIEATFEQYYLLISSYQMKSSKRRRELSELKDFALIKIREINYALAEVFERSLLPMIPTVSENLPSLILEVYDTFPGQCHVMICRLTYF